MHGVRIETLPPFTASSPSNMPVRGFEWSASVRKYDITPDGKQFVMLYVPQATSAANSASAAGTTEAQEIRVVLNWLEELKRLSPIPK